MHEQTSPREDFMDARGRSAFSCPLSTKKIICRLGTVDRLLKALSITVAKITRNTDCERWQYGWHRNGRGRTRRASNPKIRAIHNWERTGLGGAYQRGVKEASKSFFVYIPGDNTWPYRSFLELFGNLGKADVVATSYTTNANVRPWGRRIVSRLYTKTLNVLHRKRMKYYNGLTIYPLSFLRSVNISTTGFGFQAEILLNALYRGLSVVEVALPIDERTAGGSKAVNIKNIASVRRP